MHIPNRVDRVLSFFSSRPIWDPNPLTPSPFGSRRGSHIRLRERGCGGHNSDDGTHRVVLKYVLCDMPYILYSR